MILSALFLLAADFVPRVDGVERLTQTRGCDEMPVFTPDDRTIVYDAVIDGGYGLFRMDLASKKPTRLSKQNEEYWDYWSDWDYAARVSPDGRQVAYLHDTSEGSELRLLPIEGDAKAAPLVLAKGLKDADPMWIGKDAIAAAKNASELVRVEVPSGKLSLLARAPAGAEIYNLFTLLDGTLYARMVTSSADHSPSKLMRLRQGEDRFEEVALTPGGPRDVGYRGGFGSKDNTRFYQRRGFAFEDAELVWREAAGGVGHVVEGIVHPTMGFAISHDRKKLVYSDCYEFNTVGKLTTADALVKEILQRSGSFVRHGARRMPGGDVLYTVFHDGKKHLERLTEASGERRKVVDDAVEGDADPASDAIVYLDKPGDASRGVRLLRSSKTGAAMLTTVLTKDPSDRAPTFGKRGATVVFMRGDKNALFEIGSDGKGPARALRIEDVEVFSVSPADGRVVFVDSKRRRLFERLAGTREDHPYFAGQDEDRTARYTSVRFSADGKSLLLVRAQKEVLVVDVDGKRQLRSLVDTGSIGLTTADFGGPGEVLLGMRVWDGDLWLAKGDFP